MSRQLTISASFSVLAAALFAVSASLGGGPAGGARNAPGAAPLAEFSIGH